MPVLMHKGIPYGEGTNTLDGLNDVSISNPSDNDVLKYNSSIGKFVNGTGGSSATEIPGTLAAGETTVTLQNAAITTNSKIDYYADVFGVHPINAAVTDGQIVLTYRPRATATNIKVVVS